MSAIIKIAKKEFSMVARNPLIILFGVIVVIYALVNAAGCSDRKSVV